ncbi:MAG: hypothetical protein DRI90_24605 [Deltaproteobacteria bacterium]|nr:MAG: hypothetical protein DRI90_24605 [Deltaproteobacteria bacterium]
MEFSTDVTLPFDRDTVFATYRDRLSELVDYLPNIRGIEVTQRSESPDGDVELVNEWVGGGDIPKVVRSAIKESMLQWTDYATWHGASYTTDWRIDIHAFPGALECHGTNRYLEVEGGTRLVIAGTLSCDASQVPAVPGFLVNKVGRTVEKFLVGKIAPNLEEIAHGVGRYLADQG